MTFDYGDEVLLTVDAGMAASKAGVAVGITHVDSEAQSRSFNYPVETVLYTIEFTDGSDALLPETALRRGAIS